MELVASNGPEMASAFLSITAAGSCAPLNPAYTAEEFAFFLGDLRPAALVLQEGIAGARPKRPQTGDQGDLPAR